MNNTSKDYLALIEEGGIFSRSKVKGTFILPPNGLKVWNIIKDFLNREFSKLGVEEVSLPSLIPFSLLSKEKDHVKGFSPEVFFVSSGKDDRESSLVLRPTSEALFYDWFSSLLKSQRQLPIAYNQWCQVFRIEKNTKPFLRNSEFLWQEGHTLHSSEKEAHDFAIKILSVYKKYIENLLCLSVISGIKTQNEKFAGALKTYTVECLLPDYQCLQVATTHFFSDKFSRVFSVKFNSSNNKQEFPHSTSWGTSTRSIGAVALSHFDQKGLVFPFDLSPVQVAIIKYGNSSNLDEYASVVEDDLSSRYRVRNYCSSSQANINIIISEREGCPFKIIIGEKEVRNDTLTVSIRTNEYKTVIRRKEIFHFIEKEKNNISKILLEKSLKNTTENTFKVDSYDEFISLKKQKRGLFVVPFCNVTECEREFKKNFSPLSFRCILNENINKEKSCIFCMRYFSYEAVVGRSY